MKNYTKYNLQHFFPHLNKWIRNAVRGLYFSNLRISSNMGGNSSVIAATVMETAFWRHNEEILILIN
jgi:hypothetical protein